MENNEDKKEIEIITGDDSDLDISTVYDHLNLDKIRNNPGKQNIIIPGIKKGENNTETENKNNK